jgi:hypothetical protein
MFESIMSDLSAIHEEVLRVKALLDSSLHAEQASQIASGVKSILDEMKALA